MWLRYGVDERMRVPTPLTFHAQKLSMAERKKTLQKGNLQTYKSRRALGEKGESCEPGCPYKKVAKIDL